jgi:hypothetical protein
MPDEDKPTSDEDVRNIRSAPHFILTLPGIRTYGQWQNRFRTLLEGEGSTAQIIHFNYGVFSLISYILPFLRWIKVWRFRRYLKSLARTHPDARIDIVAHSFGTYIVGHSLKRLASKGPVEIHTVILAGSVLKLSFPWNDLIAKKVVKRVVNDCGTQDNILLVSQLFVLLTGMAGRVGFTGFLDEHFKNRFYEFGHGGYFEPFGEENPDEKTPVVFMRN